MGWAIGFAPVHGDGIIISDTRVIFTLMENEPAADCLQKIHYVGPNILAGFAGSVKIGFRTIAEMKKQLGSARKDQGWDLDEISKVWIPNLLAHIYDNAEQSEKPLGLEVLLVGAHPHKVHGGSPSPWIDAFRFSSPEFQREKGFMNRPLIIGNPGTIPYPIVELCSRQFSVQMQMGDQPEHASAIATVIRKHIADPSKSFQVGLINRGNSAITECGEINVIQSYGNFAKFCAERKLEPFCALA